MVLVILLGIVAFFFYRWSRPEITPLYETPYHQPRKIRDPAMEQMEAAYKAYCLSSFDSRG